MYVYNFRPLVRVFCRGLSRERTIGNAQPDSVFIDVQQFYLAIDISNLAFLSSTCSVYFMRPQIRRPAALEVSRKGEKYESDGVKRLPSPKRIYELISSNRDFNKFNFRSRHSLSRFFYRDLLNPRQNNLCDATTSILQYREFYKDAYVCVCIYIYAWFTFSSHRRLLPMYLPNRSLNTPIYLKVTLIYRVNTYTWTSSDLFCILGFFSFFFFPFFKNGFFKGIGPVLETEEEER